MPNENAPSRPEVRKMLREQLPGDADFDAFCLDYFPPVHFRFGAGMDRLIKENLLLQNAGSQLIVDRLQEARNTNPQSPLTSDPRTARGATQSSAGASAALLGPVRNRYALLIGINRYVDPSFSTLRYCVNDVRALEQLLTELGYIVVALHDDAKEEHRIPTRENIEAELESLCSAVGQEDMLLVYFACHGKLIAGEPVLISRSDRAPTLQNKALRVRDIEERLKKSEARRLVLILDACHAGVSVGREVNDPEFLHRVHELAEGFALLAASTSQQVAWESAEQQLGVFSSFLLAALRGGADRTGKGFVTVDDVKVYVLNELTKWRVKHGAIQQPTARTAGLGDMILAYYRVLKGTS